jgi:mRNA-degrading endonuclease toxin of MazEF toxin-antitoxin module
MDDLIEIINQILKWTKVKCLIHKEKTTEVFFGEREIWWAHIGQNVGTELNGKNDLFDRPVLIIKKFNQHMLWILPMTTTDKDNKYYVPTSFEAGQKQSKVVLSQIRTISSLRLIKKQRTLPEAEFKTVRAKLIELLK